MFDKVAEEYAKKIGRDVKNTQIRKFYDYVLSYEEKCKALKCNEEFQSDILPFVKMLNSKVAYASTRNSGGSKLVNPAFVEMIRDCISVVKTIEDMKNFKLFFEAVIGFHREVEAKKGSN